ncbi:hypothetical protein SS1G_09191 [Sclerotinia sclerotiorum 1980 UF-70]|uniref:Asteroid domain-containing protein n=1 Tax=Sclerotinia sclerotiorum (strain ATCC 18683 / 1980 / Ss-1) TaxID=665079 RepID=A7EV33_SCLS1|nr:hypothetical protein SS1G_09191 [Sclerotinia sclerotiorum 1980 UF-70]EDN93325.1 hypothetical protein SS1G_09191 [Sclerotinia sclerotiorum 1980 UF-70]
MAGWLREKWCCCQLEKYHKDYASGLRYRLSSTNWITPASFPFAFAPQRSSFIKIPASSFLVPSIIEALQNSNKYKDIVEIVPGEADTFCASYVSQHGGIILTGDSDLLVHEIGIDSSVSFFQDVELSSKADPWMLQSQVFHAGSIVKRLGLPPSHGIRALAFEIVMDSHGTFSKLLKQATTLSAIKQHKGMYADFVKEYLPVDFDLAIFDSTLVKRSLVKTALQALDPRVFGERRKSIFEHKRQASTSRGREWEIPAASDISRACTEVLTFLRGSQTKLEGQCIADTWTSVAFIQDAEWSESIDKVSLGKKVLAGLGASNSDDISPKKSELNWDKIHFMAEIQGSYYSFRILKQLTTFSILIGGRESVSGPLLELNDLLQDLPSLNTHNGFEKLDYMLTTIKESILEDSYQEKELSASISAEKSKQRKKRKRDQLTSSRTANKKPTNPFDVLGSDW